MERNQVSKVGRETATRAVPFALLFVLTTRRTTARRGGRRSRHLRRAVGTYEEGSETVLTATGSDTVDGLTLGGETVLEGVELPKRREQEAGQKERRNS